MRITRAAYLIAALIALMVLVLSGCEESKKYTYVSLYRSGWARAHKISLPYGYGLNAGCPFSTVETEQGFDLVLHFVEGD